MTSSHWRFAITFAFLVVASILPATVRAQTPAFVTQWGSFGIGDGQFNYPDGVATDAAGNVYVADSGNNRVQKFTSSGAYVTQWGSFGVGVGQFFAPVGVAADAAGDVYVADWNNCRIEKFTDTGTYLTQWGSLGNGDGLFDHPAATTTDAGGDVYVADASNHRIQKFTSTGTFLLQWGSPGTGNGQFNSPLGIATDDAGNVYVADTFNDRIQKFTGTGTYLTQWGSLGSGDGQFSQPIGVATDAAGTVYVVDTVNNRIQRFTTAGTYLAQWGSFGSGDGQFIQPFGVATDAEGKVYIADTVNSRIQKFDPSPLAMAFDLTPNTLNLASRGRWVTGFLEPASPYSARDIDIASIRLNGTVLVDPAAPSTIGDQNRNGALDLIVKFNRAAVELALSGGAGPAVTVTGTMAGHAFVGTDENQRRHEFASIRPAGVDEQGAAEFALRGATPNPASHELLASFSLKDSKAATLALFDVGGRQLTERRVDELGPGWHTVDLGGRSNLAAGIYYIRLSEQDEVSLTTRAVLLR